MKNLFQKSALALIAVVAASPAFAEEAAAATSGPANGLVAIAAALVLGVAALGGALGQGRAASSALEGVARNPAASGKLLLPLILSLAFIEAMSIYALVIAFQLVGKI